MQSHKTCGISVYWELEPVQPFHFVLVNFTLFTSDSGGSPPSARPSSPAAERQEITRASFSTSSRSVCLHSFNLTIRRRFRVKCLSVVRWAWPPFHQADSWGNVFSSGNTWVLYPFSSLKHLSPRSSWHVRRQSLKIAAHHGFLCLSIPLTIYTKLTSWHKSVNQHHELFKVLLVHQSQTVHTVYDGLHSTVQPAPSYRGVLFNDLNTSITWLNTEIDWFYFCKEGFWDFIMCVNQSVFCFLFLNLALYPVYILFLSISY